MWISMRIFAFVFVIFNASAGYAENPFERAVLPVSNAERRVLEVKQAQEDDEKSRLDKIWIEAEFQTELAIKQFAIQIMVLQELGYSEELISNLKEYQFPSEDRDTLQIENISSLLTKDDLDLVGGGNIMGYLIGDKYWCMRWNTMEISGYDPDTRSFIGRFFNFSEGSGGIQLSSEYHTRCWTVEDYRVVDPQ